MLILLGSLRVLRFPTSLGAAPPPTQAAFYPGFHVAHPGCYITILEKWEKLVSVNNVRLCVSVFSIS